MSTIKFLKPDEKFFVNTPLGTGVPIGVIDYGIDINSVWFVVLDETRELQHVLSSDLRVMGNPMMGTKDGKFLNKVEEKYPKTKELGEIYQSCVSELKFDPTTETETEIVKGILVPRELHTIK